MNAHQTLDRLDDLIRSRSILQHPFYVAWQRGELTHPQLATYASMYYPHVAAFPGYLRSAIDSTQDPEIRSELEANLADEISNPRPHNELWLDFAESLGLDRVEVAQADPSPAARDIVNTFDQLARDGGGTALVALYAYESQQPEVAQEKVKGLRDQYGINETKALEYFEVHAWMDLHHRDGERRAIRHCLENGAYPDVVLSAAELALDAYWSLLDDICEEAGISC